MADLSILNKGLRQYKNTLKQTSFDKENNVYVCNSENIVYDFDKYKDDNHSGKKSFDVLYFKDDNVLCLEFKNQYLNGINKSQILGKFIDGLDMLKTLFNKHNLAIKDYIFYICVAHKDTLPNKKYRARGESNELEKLLLANFDKEYHKVIVKEVSQFKRFYNIFFSDNFVC